MADSYSRQLANDMRLSKIDFDTPEHLSNKNPSRLFHVYYLGGIDFVPVLIRVPGEQSRRIQSAAENNQTPSKMRSRSTVRHTPRRQKLDPSFSDASRLRSSTVCE